MHTSVQNLINIQNEIKSNHALEVAELDVSQFGNVRKVLFELSEKLGGAKIIIANAGVSEKSFPGEGTFNLDRRIIEINFLGAIATIDLRRAIVEESGLSSWAACRLQPQVVEADRERALVVDQDARTYRVGGGAAEPAR